MSGDEGARESGYEEPVFHARCTGWSAGLNAATFFTCGVCGACIVEMDAQHDARHLHVEWHAEHNASPEGER